MYALWYWSCTSKCMPLWECFPGTFKRLLRVFWTMCTLLCFFIMQNYLFRDCTIAHWWIPISKERYARHNATDKNIWLVSATHVRLDRRHLGLLYFQPHWPRCLHASGAWCWTKLMKGVGVISCAYCGKLITDKKQSLHISERRNGSYGAQRNCGV
jgi:hypothetical protein